MTVAHTRACRARAGRATAAVVVVALADERRNGLVSLKPKKSLMSNLSSAAPGGGAAK